MRSWKDFYSGNPADAVGTGPFMMEEFIPDERIVLVRNPNYWRKGADGKALPYVDNVIVTAGWDDAPDSRPSSATRRTS